MYFKIATIILIFQYASAGSSYYQGHTDASWPENLKMDFPFPTYSPMRIDTSLVKPLNSSTIKITIPIHKKLHVTNNGNTVVASLRDSNEKFTLTDGCFHGEEYYFANVFFRWTNDREEYTGAKVDDVGAPLMAVVTFYNRRYNSVEEAKKHRDGVVLFVVKLTVQGKIQNKDFSNFETVLHSLTAAGSNAEASVGDTTSYFGLGPVPTYYAYPGSYYQNMNEKQLFSATIIELPKSHYPYISIQQFSAFTNLKNAHDSPIDARLTSYAPDQRPLIQGSGIIHKVVE